MLYLYAITDHVDAPLPPESGIADEPLVNSTYKDIAAVVSQLAVVRVEPTEANVWRHETVLEALMQQRTVLPVRFGTAISDAEAVYGILATHYASFTKNLQKVCGRVELGLRVLWDPLRQAADESASLPSQSGYDYMLARLDEHRRKQEQQQQAEALVTEIQAPLLRLAVEHRQRVLITPRMLLSAAYLVDRSAEAAFHESVSLLTEAYPTLQFLCTGPWPAYNFVELGSAVLRASDNV